MGIFTSGVTGIQVSQRAIETIGNNIANANTPGYHRQVVNIVPSLPVNQQGFLVGTGVDVSQISRVRSEVLERALLTNKYELGETSARTRGLRTAETILSPGTGAINTHLDQLFAQFEELELTGRLSDIPLRSTVIGGAVGFSAELNRLANSLNVTRGDINAEVTQLVDEINSRLHEVASINSQLLRAEGLGITANDLRDRREAVVAEIAERIDVEFVQQAGGQSTLAVGGTPVVIGGDVTDITAFVNSTTQNLEIRTSATSPAFGVSSGQLKAQLDLYNEIIPDFQNRLEEYTHELIRTLDKAHSTGVGLDGGFTLLDSKRGVNNLAALLNNAGLSFPPSGGVLTVGVTNTATDQRTITQLTIDPATQSLNDIITALNTVANITAVGNSQSGTLTIQAGNGYQFDFTGGYSTNPAGVGFTGTSIPSLSGVYSGTTNDDYTFTVSGTGTVGVTAGLQLIVTDQSANTIATLNIGQGYSPGTALDVRNGIKVKMATGTVNNGESFSSNIVAQADTSSILAALGLNTLFTGNDASTIQVDQDIVDNPQRLAASVTRETNDGTNLRRLIDSRQQKVLNNGTQTFEEFFNTMISDIGRFVKESSELEESQTAIGEKIFNEREALSGVDPNEELVNLIQFQKMFELSSKYISVVNSALDSLLTII